MDAPEGAEEDRSVVIVGGGPAGLVTAAHFARRGYDVEVFEKRPPIDPSKEVNNSFTIVLNYKGISSIQAAGLSLDSFFKFPLLACVRHTLHAAIPFLQPPLGTAAAFERAELTKWLADSVQQQHPNVRIHYNATCTDIDFNNRLAHFQRPDGTTTTADYDLLIGADGANSAVRGLLQQAVPQFAFTQKSAPLVYKRFRRQPCPVDLAEGYGKGSVVHFYRLTMMPPAPPSSDSLQRQGSTNSAAGGSLKRAMSPRTPRTPRGGTTSAAAAAGGGGGDGGFSSGADGGGGGAAGGSGGGGESATSPRQRRGRSSNPSSPSARSARSSSLSRSRSGASAGGGERVSSPSGAAADISSKLRAQWAGPHKIYGFLAVCNHEDGSVSGGLSVYQEVQERLVTLDDFTAMLADLTIPDPGFKSRLCQLLADTPWTWGGSWVACSQLHGPRAVLLGDAAHACSPSLGQGCNCALEDVTVLDEVMEDLEGDLECVPEEFSARRLPEVTALVWLDRRARAMRGQQGLLHPCFAMYLAHMYIRPRLAAALPAWVEPPLMAQLWERPTSYVAVKQQMIWDGVRLGVGLAAVGLGVGAAVAAAVARKR